jgi:purine-binding chemotaxis protein CheW
MSPTDEVQLCVLRVGGEEYVVDIRRVEEILPVPALTVVPRAPKFLEGVVRLRNDVLPVIDVRKRLGVTPRRTSKRHRDKLVVCRVGRRRVGLVVDAVTQVLRVPRSEMKPAPLAATPGRQPHVLGVTGSERQLRMLLDVKALLVEDIDP